MGHRTHNVCRSSNKGYANACQHCPTQGDERVENGMHFVDGSFMWHILKRPHGGYGNHVWSWQGGKIWAESDCWGEKQSGHSGSLREVPQSWSSGLEGVIITSIQAPSGLGLAISTVWPLRFHQGLTLHRQFILPLRRRVVLMTGKQVPKEICKEGCLEGLKYRQDELGARLGAVKSSS